MNTPFLESLVFKHIAPRGIRYLTPINDAHTSELVAQVYSQMGREFQLAPPFTVHSLIPELLAGVWTASRESLICGPADRVAREAIAIAVSRINACPYCVDVHGMMLNGAGQHELAHTLTNAQESKLTDTGTADLVRWALATRSPAAPVLAAPPFSPVDAPQMIGTAVLFHYINRIVNVFLHESLIPSRTPKFVKRLVGSAMTSRMVEVVAEPGQSLHFLPNDHLPPDLNWAVPNPAVAGGFSRMAGVVERVGEAALSGPTRELLLARLQLWRGEDMGLSQGWVENAIAGLSPEERPRARLALLAAFASHQVDDGVIGACRAAGVGEATLLAVVAWASFCVARKVGTWLTLPGNL